ncbi:MAG: phosphodiesterase [Armatimonadetes bacterium]|nr:phosphodiesterase [Armatimonadota bacterium]
MTIGVVSDTHGRIDAWRKVEVLFSGVDLVIHAGDVLYHPPRLGCSEGYDVPALAESLNQFPAPVVIAQGNCDAQVYEELLNMPVQSPYALVEFEGLRIVATHGHLFSTEQMIAMGKRFGADVLVSGHTHLPVLERTDDLILLNPGSPSIPKFEQGGRKIGSIGLITDSEIRIIAVDDGRTLFNLAR